MTAAGVAAPRLWCAGWASGWLLLSAFRTLRLDASVRGVRRPIVLVPARNEARSLPLLLDDLARQTLRPGAVVVVDDESADGTAHAASASGAHVVHGSPTPDGWAGKPWAIHQGIMCYSARWEPDDVLIFLDADVRLAPTAVEALIASHGTTGGLLSVAPEHRCGSVAERLSAVANAVAVMGSGAGLPSAHGRARAAFGPVMVCRFDDYRRSGGHAASPADVADDLALAEAFTWAGLATTVRRGGALVGYRMYPDGIAQQVEGWSKNLAVGARRTHPLACAGAALWVGSLLTCLAPGRRRTVRYALTSAQLAVLLPRIGRFGLATPLFGPVLAAWFTALFARSVLKTARGDVVWRGRRIPSGRAPRGEQPRPTCGQGARGHAG